MARRVAREMARGQIWTYEFLKPDKTRPVLILSRDEAIRFLHAVMVAPITSTVRGLPSEVLIGPEEGLRKTSAVKLDHVQTVEKARLRRFVGALGSRRLREVCRALAVATGCDAASAR